MAPSERIQPYDLILLYAAQIFYHLYLKTNKPKKSFFEVKYFLLEENLASLALAFEALLSLPSLARL